MSDSYFVCVGISIAISVLYNLVLRVVSSEGARAMRAAACDMLRLRYRVLMAVSGVWLNGWFLWVLPMWLSVPFLALCMAMGILAARLAPPYKPVTLPVVCGAWPIQSRENAIHQRMQMALAEGETQAYAVYLSMDDEAYAAWNEARFRNEKLADEFCDSDFDCK